MGGRALRPVVCVGYGRTGTAWLRRVERLCRDLPLPKSLMARRVLQFWAVDSSEEPDGKHWWNPSPSRDDAASLRMVIDEGRRDDLRALFPGLEMQRILVLERLPLYDEPSIHAIWLHDTLTRASHAAPQEHPEFAAFETECVTLADATWPGEAPNDAARTRAKELATKIESWRTLFIDRQSGAQGVVARSDADDIFARLAGAMLGGDLAFPRLEAGNEGGSDTLRQRSEADSVSPISFLTLRHPSAPFVRARTALLRQQLAGGPEPGVDDVLREREQEARPLPEAVEADLSDLLSSGGLTRAGRERRRAAVRAFVTWCLREADPVGAAGQVDRLRERIRQLRARTLPHVAPVNSRAVIVGGGLGSLTAGVVAILLLGALALLYSRRWKRGAAPLDPAASPGAQASEADRGRLLSDWERIADNLDAFIDSWRDLLARERAAQVHSAESAWALDPSSPYCWVVNDVPMPHSRNRTASATVYERVGDSMIEELLHGADDKALLEKAIIEIAEQDWANQPSLRIAALERLLTDPQDRPVRHAVRQAALLAHAPGAARQHEVNWVTGAMALEPRLLDLEAPLVRPRARVLMYDDVDQTVRIAFGEDVRWSAIASLAFNR